MAVSGPYQIHFDLTGHGIIKPNLDVASGPNAVANVNPNARILASVCEIDSMGNPHMGDANIQVTNIVPTIGYVQVFINILWNSDINIRVRFFIWTDV
jgi:hypothetical protein